MKSRKQNRAFTLVELLVVIVILGILMALLLPAIAAAIKNAKITNCGSNLSQLVKAMYNYSITKAPIEGGFPTGGGFTGTAFWTTLFSTKEVDDPKVLVCPVYAGTAATGTVTDFTGPKAGTNVNIYAAKDAIGADRRSAIDLHGHTNDTKVAYNWVGKSGDVHKVPHDNVGKWTEINSTLD